MMKRTHLALSMVALFTLLPVQAQSLPLITVMDFESTAVSDAELLPVVDLVTTIIYETGHYRVLERSQRYKLLEEMEFSLSGLIDESSQIKMGQLLASDLVVLGSLADTSGSYMLTMRLVNVETGETGNSVSGSFRSMDELQLGVRPMVYSLVNVDMDQAFLDQSAALKLHDRSLQVRYDRQLKKIDSAEYYDWAVSTHLVQRHSSAYPAERLALLDEYLYSLQTKGFAPGAYIALGGGRTYENSFQNKTTTHYSIKDAILGLSLPYILDNLVNIGVWGFAGLGLTSMDQFDNITSELIDSESGLLSFDFGGGVMAGWGDPIGGLAVRCGFGLVSFHEAIEQQAFGIYSLEILFKGLQFQLLFPGFLDGGAPIIALYIGAGYVLYPGAK